MPECLHCGRETTYSLHQTSGSRVGKRVNLDPTGYYYFVFCERCSTMPRREYSALWKTYPDRLYHSMTRYEDKSEAIRNLFSGTKPPG